jgi:parallel beta-helix repeat protein
MKDVLFANIVKILGFFFFTPIYAFATTGTMSITANTILTEDHFGKIIISANGVTLDCKNFKVVGTGTGHGIDIDGRLGVSVKFCHTQNFGVGFNLQNSSNTILFKNSSTQNFSTSGGFFIKNCHNRIMISRNTSFRNIRGRGFAIESSSGVIISKNNAHHNGFRGIQVGNSSNILLEKNEASNNGSAGVVIFNSFKITAEKNIVQKSTYEGFAILGTKDSKFEKNEAKNNNTYGFRVSGGSNNLFEKNTAYSNGVLDLLDSSCPSLSNTWISNSFNTANCLGIN